MTDTWLQNAKGRSDRYDVTVDGRRGLMVRVHPSGVASFRFRYKRGGKQYVMVLGEYPHLSLAAAYDQHTQALKELENGLDPIEERGKREAERERQRQEYATAGTVADLVEQFVHRKLRAERWDEATSSWIRDAKAKTKPRKRPDAAAALLKNNLVESKLDGKKVGDMKAKDITRRQLVALLDAIVDRGAPVLANRVHALVKQCFTYGAAKDIIPASPVAGIERPGGEEKPRERVLTEEEVKKVWEKLTDAKMALATRLALKLLLVTAQRRSEVTQAKWAHFDLKAKEWTVPAALSKNGKAHTVPLSPLALEILVELKKLTGNEEWLLPTQYSKKKAGEPYSERVLTRAVRDNQEHFGIEHFTPHDLRRTAASFMTRLGTPRLHVEKVLNHTTADIAEVYDRHDYADEKRAALDRWGAHLEDIIAGRPKKVVPIKSATLA